MRTESSKTIRYVAAVNRATWPNDEAVVRRRVSVLQHDGGPARYAHVVGVGSFVDRKAKTRMLTGYPCGGNTIGMVNRSRRYETLADRGKKEDRRRPPI